MARRVFVSGAYSSGDIILNVRAAILVADELMGLGYAPYVPHLSSLAHLVCPRSYEEWLALDFVWLQCCDAVLRLPGHSPGGDRETALARSLGIPVYDSVASLCEEALP